MRNDKDKDNAANMSMWKKQNQCGGWEVWQDVGAAREHVGTFKREKFADQFMAAPELLAALQSLVAAADDPDNSKDRDLIEQIDWRNIRNAIARATGE